MVGGGGQTPPPLPAINDQSKTKRFSSIQFNNCLVKVRPVSAEETLRKAYTCRLKSHINHIAALIPLCKKQFTFSHLLLLRIKIRKVVFNLLLF